MKEKLFAALDLGSSRIIGAVGRRDDEGNVEILFHEELESDDGFRHGRVFNLNTVSEKILKIMRLLSNRVSLFLNAGVEEDEKNSYEITCVYVSLNGRTIKTYSNNALRNNVNNEIVSQQIVDDLLNEGRSLSSQTGDVEVLSVIPQEYNVDDDDVVNPIGCRCVRIEGRYKVVVAEKLLRENVLRCVERGGYSVADYMLAPVAAADAVLSESNKKIGCALIDFGASTISLSIYHNDILRYVAVIPVGSSLITKDLCCFKITENEAERIKTKAGMAKMMVEDGDNSYLVVNKEVTLRYSMLIEAIESRLDEFISILMSHFERSGFRKCIDEIVLVGGGSKLHYIVNKFEESFGINTRLGVIDQCVSPNMAEEYRNPKYAQVYGLIKNATVPSVGIKVVEPEPEKKSVKRKETKKTSFKDLLLDKVKNMLTPDDMFDIDN